jgi:hypothetical protein
MRAALALAVIATVAVCTSCAAKVGGDKKDSTGVATSPQTPAPPTNPVPPPATQLEAFKPTAGSVATFAYDNLPRIQNINIDARELRDTKGGAVRGLLVAIKQSEYRDERSFVDMDEIPELIKGIDAVAAVNVNPTKFENFEVHYQTRGGLDVTAFNTAPGKLPMRCRWGGSQRRRVLYQRRNWPSCAQTLPRR